MIDRVELRLAVADGARAVARHYLRQGAEASERLASDGKDEEALHDFRVAVRRLRSWISAFEVELSDVRKRDRRKLRKIAHATNPGRDAQVQLEWIDDVVKHGSASERSAARRLRDAFDDRRQEYEKDVAELVEKKWPHLEKTLRERLNSKNDGIGTTTLADAIAARLPSDVEVVWLALAEVHRISDDRQAHEARIAAKRLRYLIEPAAPHLPSGELLREHLKELQDELGRLHDLHLLAGEVFDVVPLATRLRRDLKATFDEIRSHWLRQPMILEVEIDAVADELRALSQ